ncbi:HipA N-terminal domain-containing protein [Aequorivita flava]|uniref:HipA N-terminal subdomain 1 domain-containing protein n=1 Tax=Aequorivita flava TaxID=3114371 RepID=A0AB35YYH8_9FLAO
MLKQFKKYIKSQSKAKDLPCTYEQINQNPKFQLKYNENIIGYLDYDGTVWSFIYSTWFKDQSEFEPLFEFPLKDKVYISSELWPFFESRIPSLKQPKLQEYLESHPSDRNNKVKLLELFGITSVNNPYKLTLNL